MFICTRCGICCRNIDKIPELTDFHTGDGVCIHLSDNNLCDIYSTRPDICNVEKMFELHYKKMMSKTGYEKMNLEGCRALQSKKMKGSCCFRE